MADRLRELEDIVRRSPAVCFLWRAAEGWPVELVTDNVDQLGYSPQDFLSDKIPYASIIHPDDLERVVSLVHERTAAGDPEFSLEYRILTKSREVRWVNELSWVRRDETGAITHFQGIVLDVTSRKRAEEELQQHRDHLEEMIAQRTAQQRSVEAALRESEEKYRTVLEHSHDGIFMALDGIIIICNQAFASMIGARVEEVQGHALADFIAPEDRELVLGRHRQRLAGEQVPESYEFRALHRDGTTPVLVHMSVGSGTYLGANAVIGTLRNITQERLQEIALRASREQLHEITETVPGVTFQFFARADGTRGVYFAAETGREVFGFDYELSEFFPRFIERVVPEDRERLLASIDEAVRNVSPWSFEGRFARPDGQILWIRAVSRPVVHGDEIVFSGLLEDISERVRVEQALRDSESKYRTVIENIQDAFYRADAEGRLVMASPSLARILGYESLDECLGKDIAQSFYADPASRSALLLALGDRGSVTDFEVTLRRRDGSLLEAATSSRLWVDDRGNTIGIEGIFRDATEPRRAKEALREAKERMQRFLSGSPIPCFVIGPDHVVVLWNDALSRLTGIGADQMVGTRDHWRAFYRSSRPCLADFLMASDIPAIESWYGGKVTRSKLVEAAFEGEDFFAELGNEGKWLHFTAAAVRDGTGTLIGAIETIEDISERRRAEEQLRQAQRMESVGRLAAGVAHDFNNLLTPIMGFSGFLLAGFQPADVRYGQAEEILRAAEGARNLTRQLLAFSSKQVLDLHAIDLRDIVDGIQNLLRRTLREDIKLIVQLAPEPCTIVAEMGQIEQVLMNLMVNSQDAMPRGGSVTVTVKPVVLEAAKAGSPGGVAPGAYVELAVSDTGIGMDENTRAHAFEPFFTTKGHGSGTGLGLATVHGIVTQHGGTILLETSPGSGTLFRILFPASATVPKKARSEYPPAGAADQPAETVMVVEDNALVLSFTVSALQSAGYDVLSASSARECMEILARHRGPLDLLVTDVVMPNLNGRELAERVRGRFPRTAILFVSGYPQDVIAQQGMIEKGINLLRKPFSLLELMARVREVIDESRRT